MQKYEVTNWNNGYSEQLYPIEIKKVLYVNFISKSYPNGCMQISCMSVDGYYTTGLLKCYISKKGRYAIWGKHRIYEGYHGPVELIGVPYSLQKAIQSCAEQYGSLIR